MSKSSPQLELLELARSLKSYVQDDMEKGKKRPILS